MCVFVWKVVEARLGTLIHGQLDQLERGVLFTDAFVARQMACIRGVFSAITKYVLKNSDDGDDDGDDDDLMMMMMMMMMMMIVIVLYL